MLTILSTLFHWLEAPESLGLAAPAVLLGAQFDGLEGLAAAETQLSGLPYAGS